MRNEFKILSYNTHLFGGTVPSLKESYHDKERCNSIIDYVSVCGADIVCLCEIWSDSCKKTIVEKLENTYLYNLYCPTPWYQMGSGLLMLSKYQLDCPQFEEFQNLSGWDEISQKGFISVCVNYEQNKHFRIFFTHTQADKDYCVQRQSNFAQIISGISNYHPMIPTIILGDFNIIAGTEEYKWLIQHLSGFTDSFASIYPGNPGYTLDPINNSLAKIFDSEEQSQRIDYMMYSNNNWSVDSFSVIKNYITTGSTGTFDCSDHYPIEAVFTLKT